MRHIRSVTSALSTALVVVLALGATACSDPEPSEPAPSTPTKASPQPTSTSTPRGAALSADQQAEYEKALARWTEYTVRSEPIWAAGKMTPKATEVFKDYWITYGLLVDELETNERSGITRSGVAEVKDSWPVEVGIKDYLTTVTLAQCVDGSTMVYSPPAVSQPDTYVLFTIVMKKTDQGYKAASATALNSDGEVVPCDA